MKRLTTNKMRGTLSCACAALAVTTLFVAAPRASLAQTSAGAPAAPGMRRPQPADEEVTVRSPNDVKGAKSVVPAFNIVDPDRDFAVRVRRHEDAALQLAEAEMQTGKDVEMRAIAKRIVDSHKQNIEKLDAWLARRKIPTVPRMLLPQKGN